MKGFGIYVKNDLLEPKHIQNMGEAVWLYLWLLDKMTSVNENGIGKVLGNQPITHDLVTIELGIPLRTYRRWVTKLRETGYIHTTRTPYGLVIVISKATKRFKKASKRSATSGTSSSATNGTSLIPEMGQIVSSDVPQTVQRSAKLAHVIKTKQDITKTKQVTNVTESTIPVYGKPEINNLFSYWESKTGIGIQAKRQANRNACNNLVRTHGVEKVQRLIDGVAISRSDQYAPRIADFCDLQSKLNQLLIWGNARTKQQKGVIKI